MDQILWKVLEYRRKSNNKSPYSLYSSRGGQITVVSKTCCVSDAEKSSGEE